MLTSLQLDLSSRLTMESASSTNEDDIKDLFGHVANREIDLQIILGFASAKNIDLVRVRDSQLQTTLHIAAGYGRKRTVEYLISLGADANAQDNKGRTPLHYACSHAHKTIAGLLIEAGAQVNIADSNDWTPLLFAVTRKENSITVSAQYWEVVELLLANGANPFLPRDLSRNCFARLKHDKQRLSVRITYLINKLKDVNETDQVSREIIIHKYLRVQDFFKLLEEGDEKYELVDILLTQRLVNSRLDNCGNITPLHRAAGRGQLKLANLLIASGANVNAQDDSGRIPLHNAAHHGHDDMIYLLIKEGSDVNRQDSDGYTPLHEGARNKNHQTCVVLMGHGADTSITSTTGEKPSDLAQHDVLTLEVLSNVSTELIEQVVWSEPSESRLSNDLLSNDDSLMRSIGRTFENISKQHPADQNTVKKIVLSENNHWYRYVKKKMFDTIEVHTNSTCGRLSGYDITSIDLIFHKKVWKKYGISCELLKLEHSTNDVDEKLLFHGSSFVDKIIINGFDERYANRKGMFGAALYFAEHSSKSNQYTFGWDQGCQQHKDKSCHQCERAMIYARVALGACFRTKESLPDNIAAPPGYSSVAGEPGPNLRYPEYAIYRGGQAYPLFVIKYRLRL